jgi:hypothetical protein
MKKDTKTKFGLGQFNRNLRKYNRAIRNMRISHSSTYSGEYCRIRRWKKWNNVVKRLDRKYK